MLSADVPHLDSRWSADPDTAFTAEEERAFCHKSLQPGTFAAWSGVQEVPVRTRSVTKET